MDKFFGVLVCIRGNVTGTQPMSHLIPVRIIAGLWAGGIAFFSLLPADVAVTSGAWDKLEHGAAFAGLAVLISCARLLKTDFRVWSVAVLYGILIEAGQVASPGRFADPMDALANAIGAAVGLIGLTVWLKYRADKTAQQRS